MTLSCRSFVIHLLDGAAACEPAEAALDKAAALIERTGASTLAPALLEWRAELAKVLGNDALQQRLLREAQQGYQAMGAPLHAQRVESRVTRQQDVDSRAF